MTTYDTDTSIDDRAHVLSQINMHSARTPYPYSVAQGAVLRSYLASRKNALAALTCMDHAVDGIYQDPDVGGPALDAAIRAYKLERGILLGDGAAKLADMPLGQLAHLRDAVALVKRMSPERAAAAYVARYLELTGENAGGEE